MLNYLATNPDAMIQFMTSDMVLNIHSNALYLSEHNAKSRAAGYFLLSCLPRDGQPICLNGEIHAL